MGIPNHTGIAIGQYRQRSSVAFLGPLGNRLGPVMKSGVIFVAIRDFKPRTHPAHQPPPESAGQLPVRRQSFPGSGLQIRPSGNTIGVFLCHKQICPTSPPSASDRPEIFAKKRALRLTSLGTNADKPGRRHTARHPTVAKPPPEFPGHPRGQAFQIPSNTRTRRLATYTLLRDPNSCLRNFSIRTSERSSWPTINS